MARGLSRSDENIDVENMTWFRLGFFPAGATARTLTRLNAVSGVDGTVTLAAMQGLANAGNLIVRDSIFRGFGRGVVFRRSNDRPVLTLCKYRPATADDCKL